MNYARKSRDAVQRRPRALSLSSHSETKSTTGHTSRHNRPIDHFGGSTPSPRSPGRATRRSPPLRRRCHDCHCGLLCVSAPASACSSPSARESSADVRTRGGEPAAENQRRKSALAAARLLRRPPRPVSSKPDGRSPLVDRELRIGSSRHRDDERWSRRTSAPPGTCR